MILCVKTIAFFSSCYFALLFNEEESKSILNFFYIRNLKLDQGNLMLSRIFPLDRVDNIPAILHMALMW